MPRPPHPHAPDHLQSSLTPSAYTPVSLQCTLHKLAQPHHSCGQTKLGSMSNFPSVDGETCSAMHYQPKQPKTLPVLNRGGAGYETEADLWYQAQQAGDTLPNTQTGCRHPNWSQAPKLQNQT